VVPSNKSSFTGFELFTDLPCLTLAVSIEAVKGVPLPTWAEWDPTGEKIGVVVSTVRQYMPRLVTHFFGDALLPEDTEHRIKVNSPGAARRNHPHLILDVAHKMLWPGYDEMNAVIAKVIDSTLAPKWLISGVLDELQKLDNADNKQAASLFFSTRNPAAKEELVKHLLGTLLLNR
jgi:hypothetical protein